MLSLLLFAGFVVAAPPGKAVDPAGQVVEGVQQFYRKSQRLTAAFRQVSVNATFGSREESAGRVYLKKPGKMRWDYFSARDKNKVSRSQMSDGKMIWAVDVAGKSYFKLRLADSPLPVAVTFLTGKGDLAKDFSARLLTGSKHGGASDEVLELTPKAPSAQCKTLVLVVDRKSFRVKKSIVTTATGDTNELSFYEPNSSKSLADTLFVFNPKAATGFREIKPQSAPKK